MDKIKIWLLGGATMPIIVSRPAKIEILIRTNRPLHNKEAAQNFFELIASYGIHYRPLKYGRNEPMKKIFDENNLDDVILDWLGGIKLTQEQRESQYFFAGGVLMKGRTPEHIAYNIIWSNWSDISRFGVFNFISAAISKKFLEKSKGEMDIFNQFCNDLVCMFTPAHAEVYDFNSTIPCMATSNLIIPDDLTIRCPALKWRTYFGPPYIELFGRETILNAPCWKTEEVGETIVLQLTETVFEEIPQELRQSVVDYFEASVAPDLRAKLGKGFLFRPFLASEKYERSKKLVPEFPFRESFGKNLNDEEMRELLTLRPIPKKKTKK